MRFHSQFAKIHPGRGKGLVIVVLCLLLICVLAWIYYAYHIIQGDDPTSSIFSHLESYNAESSNDYRKRVSGLIYKKEESVEGVEDLNFFTLGELFEHWPPNNVAAESWHSSKAHPSNGQHVHRFDYSDPVQKDLASKYRERELPFIVYNVPELEEAIQTSFSKDSLLTSFGAEVRDVERSTDNNFMYYKMTRGKKPKDWTPPQTEIGMTFPKFLEEAEKAQVCPDEIDERKAFHYMTISAHEGVNIDWIRNSLTFLDPSDPYFIIDKSGYTGINCRFGMKGVIAAAHYDGRRNFVAMIRGRKRYVLQPPRACPMLHLLPRGHPSARHSSLQWSNMTEIRSNRDLYDSPATEVMLAMGEVLYIPSYWFHYIVSHDASIQCNTRSGNGKPGRKDIEECGFY